MKTTSDYAINVALEASRMTGSLLLAQHKKVKVDRWRKLSKYLGRTTSGRNDGSTRHDVPKGKWLKWKHEVAEA